MHSGNHLNVSAGTAASKWGAYSAQHRLIDENETRLFGLSRLDQSFLNWQFDNTIGTPGSGGVVKGTISGLLDNTPNQTSGLSITITSAPNTPPGGWLNNWSYAAGAGFSVANGLVTAYNAIYSSSNGMLFLGRNALPGEFYPELIDSSFNYDNSDRSTPAQVTFTPQSAAVPGPLPILGAASALGWSRRVRSRLRSVKGSAR
jgi:hypothetical protein